MTTAREDRTPNAPTVPAEIQQLAAMAYHQATHCLPDWLPEMQAFRAAVEAAYCAGYSQARTEQTDTPADGA